MKRKLLFGLLILAVVALPLLAACKAAPTTTPTTPPKTTAPPTTAPPTTPAAPVSITVGQAGTQMTSIDPADFFNSAPPGVYDTLINFDENNKMVGHMAESWSLSPDGKVLEFKLKKNIKFSTGDPFTSADVVFSLNRHKEKDMPIAAQLTQNFDRVEAVDDYTVRFHFPAANVQFLPQTCVGLTITSKAVYDKVGEDAYLRRPASSGPYKIVGWKEGQYIDIAYNENYWGKKPQIQKARFLAAFEQSTRVSMLQAGEVDMITQITGTNIAALEKAGFKRVDVPQAHDIVIILDLLSPNTPWSNIKVRQAINYAIDKNAIINTILGGSAQEASWLLSWELGYDPSLKPAYPYDLTKAKDLMKEAGYEKGFDLPLAYPTFMEWSKDLADYLASALKAININVKLTGVSDMPHFMPMIASIHNAYVAGKPTTPSCFLFDTGWPGNPEVVINLTNGFYMEKDNTLYDNKEVYTLIKQALGTVDNTARGELAKQAYKIINNDMPFVPIVLEVATSMMKSNIEYHPSIGGMSPGPAYLVDLTVK